MKLELKSIKIAKHLSQETLAFTATMYIDGRRVGTVTNNGCGGSHFYSVGRTVIDALNVEVAKRPRIVCPDMPPNSDGSTFSYAPNLDHWVDELIESYEEERTLKRWCRTKVVVKLATHGAGEFEVYPGSLTPELATHLRSKHGDNLAEIVNERW